MHEGIKRKSEVRCAQVAPGASRGLPYLGLHVHPLLVIDPPLTTSMPPFGSVVFVGYHRLLFISGSRVQLFVKGLYL